MGIDPTEHEIDDLRGWSPGPPGIARTTAGGALRQGLGRAARSPSLILLLWATNVAVALILVAPVYAAIHDHTASSAAAPVLSRGFTAVWWTDFSASRADVLAELGRSLWAVGALWLVLQVVLTGGVLAALHGDLRRLDLGRFGRACGTYLGRFARLFAISLAFYGGVLWLDGRALVLVESLTGAGADQAAAWWGHLLRSLLTVALFFAVMVVFDYAKVRTVVTDSRSMVLETLRALAFVLAHPVRTGLLHVGTAALGGLLMLACLAVLDGVEALGPGFVALLAIQQLYIAARIWLRLATWAGAISLYRGIAAERLAATTVPDATSSPEAARSARR